ncbi:MAG: NAD/NADP octopine/nopaline dehydrogenase family protein [Methanobrevibacter sp.]|uniref:NAD/NADP-dependent octopine/nopaline dehydrogenase family protein n=1 Tax=Methanobrevibacter sp. TaxID=66852 RepID=UPI0026DF4975|nr:NAD/NADP-dependent octopine/nopaline dehydrogenase family protein [Methanobrevibacter sp.]MDO5849533.1 NAD/NADP octopine/nopaline dehydrogenase family protein [Methanobrevibacter sp.]
MKVTIIGGGNIGTLMAAELLFKDYEVCIYTSSPEKWDSQLEVYNNNGQFLFKSDGLEVSNDIETALENTDFVFITYPSSLFKELSSLLLPHIHEGMHVGVVPGAGGAEFQFKDLIKKGAILFGLQRVHSIARLKEYGKSVYMLGRKDKIDIATFPQGHEEFVRKNLEEMFDMSCRIIDNYLNITLTPSNPILHTSRIYSMFKDSMEFDRNILFYEEWTDDSSDMLIKCDSELQKLCGKMDKFNLNEVISLKNHYESFTVPAMTEKITSIEAFKGLTSPMKKDNDKWVPDFSSRYFTSDFAYGLKIILDIGKLYDVEMPNILKIWNWYVDVSENSNFFSLADLEIDNKEEFEDYYFKERLKS